MSHGVLSCNSSDLQSVTNSYETLHANSSGSTQTVKILANNPNSSPLDFYVRKNGGTPEMIIEIPAKTTYVVFEGDLPNGWTLEGKTGDTPVAVVVGRYVQA